MREQNVVPQISNDFGVYSVHHDVNVSLDCLRYVLFALRRGARTSYLADVRRPAKNEEQRDAGPAAPGLQDEVCGPRAEDAGRGLLCSLPASPCYGRGKRLPYALFVPHPPSPFAVIGLRFFLFLLFCFLSYSGNRTALLRLGGSGSLGPLLSVGCAASAGPNLSWPINSPSHFSNSPEHRELSRATDGCRRIAQ